MSNLNTPKIVITILNWNGKKDTIECLESLKQITYSNYEILLVDNGSTDGSVECFRELYPDIEILENGKNLGFAEGNNAGIKRALEIGADYVQMLNNDTIVDRNYLTELMNAIQSYPDVGIAGPKTYHYDSPNILGCAGGFINYWKGTISHMGAGKVDSGQFEDNLELDFISGTSPIFSKELLLKIGLLDNRFFFGGGEDVDISIRAKKNGFKIIYAPKAKIWHKGETVSRKKRGAEYGYYFIRNQFLLKDKHWSTPQYICSTIYFIFSLPIYFIIFMKYYRNISIIKATAAGFIDYLFKK